MKVILCITVFVTFINAAYLPIHHNGVSPYQIDPVTGYPMMPATIPQPPPQAAAKKNDIFAYLANVPVVGDSLSKSSPQALEYLGKSMPAAIELPEMEDS